MKPKQLLVLIVVLAVAGGLGLYLRGQKQSAWKQSASAAGEKILAGFDPNAAVTLRIEAGGGQSVTLSKEEGGWAVKERGDYPADFEKIGRFVRGLWDLKAVQEVPATATQFPRLGLVEPGKEGEGDQAGVAVRLFGKDEKPLAELLLGKLHRRGAEGGGEGGIAAGRYVLPLGGGASRVALVSETFDDAEAKPEQWLQKDFVKIEGIRAIELAGAEEGMRWKLARPEPGGAWGLEGAAESEKLDTAKIPSADALLGAPRFDDIWSGEGQPQGLESPARLAVEAADGFRYAFEIGALAEGRHPVRVAVSADLAEKREPKPDEKPEDAEKLDKQFADRKAELSAKRDREKKFEGRVFLLPQHVMSPFLVKRENLIAPPPTPSPSPSPNAEVKRERISVATEPVGIPSAAPAKPAKQEGKKKP